jgi:predicted negative regulator of RcsB-dependent stress response
MLEHVGTKVTTVMVVVLLIISSLFGYAAWLHRTSGQNGNLSRKEEILISVLRTGQGIQESLWS